MRRSKFWAVAAAIVCAGLLAPDAADAHESKLHRKVRKGHVRVVYDPAPPPHHLYIRYEDPYAWQYSPRGYYPYHASHYWVPTRVVRAHRHVSYECGPMDVCYKYLPAWGYPRKHWRHSTWHHQNHGHHYPWHW